LKYFHSVNDSLTGQEIPSQTASLHLRNAGVPVAEKETAWRKMRLYGLHGFYLPTSFSLFSAALISQKRKNSE
jgi:hypothetical protein